MLKINAYVDCLYQNDLWGETFQVPEICNILGIVTLYNWTNPVFFIGDIVSWFFCVSHGCQVILVGRPTQLIYISDIYLSMINTEIQIWRTKIILLGKLTKVIPKMLLPEFSASPRDGELLIPGFSASPRDGDPGVKLEDSRWCRNLQPLPLAKHQPTPHMKSFQTVSLVLIIPI